MKRHLLFISLLTFLLGSYSNPIFAQNSANDICPILIGADMPNATLKNLEGAEIQFKDIINKKATILIVYRGSWCPYCNRHMAAIAQLEDELIAMGYQIVAISPDQPSELAGIIGKEEVKYQLFSDSKMALSDALGLSFVVDESTIKKYKVFGINLEKASGETHHKLPVPALMIIDKSSMLRFSYINPDYKVRAEPDLIRAAAKSAIE